MKTLDQLRMQQDFSSRHIGSSEQDQKAMLDHLNVASLEQLIEQIVPQDIRFNQKLPVSDAIDEQQALLELNAIIEQNQLHKSYIGMGYHPVHVPPVIGRNVLENPGWYTAYTPYQPEIAQGRLEALLNFQQMVIDLTGMEMANASLLDEATAAGEAMAMAKRANRANKSNLFFIDQHCFAQTIDVVKTRAEGLDIEVVVGDINDAPNANPFAVLVQYPDAQGSIKDLKALCDTLSSQKAMVCVATDLMALTQLAAPGEWGADIVLGNSQRFGVPMGFGGPHAAFFACKEKFKRAMPGRIIGVSKDTRGKMALRMALQTREQHIRREKANSNICTAQVLLANMAVFYAIFHGPKRLTNISTRINRLTNMLAIGLSDTPVTLVNQQFFDTITINAKDNSDAIIERATAKHVNLRVDDNGDIGISINETTQAEDILELLEIIGGPHSKTVEQLDQQAMEQNSIGAVKRTTPFLTHPVFNSHHSETNMMRYLKSLEDKDLALNHSMISLGSCTMKLNAASQMMPVSWPKLSSMHPFAPKAQTLGYQQMIDSLSDMLKAITGFDDICMQPNSGAQGEYAGLLAIQQYHKSQGQDQRDVCIIPQSAHGTNPASAQLAGLKVVVTRCDDQGNVDLDDLQAKIDEVGDRLSCLMATYPSTHGVYENGIKDMFERIHKAGGQVYMDGANLNAQVGLVRPADIGADVSHMNLHKTFAIPHGGGGPGMGPIGVKAHLAPFIANHAVSPIENESKGQRAVSAAPFGSAGILCISWMYIRSLGAQGLKASTQNALLNANYLSENLAEGYPILYRGNNNRVAHECIIDLRPIKAQTGVSEVDIAKRLMDFGFHAPTMSFPVPGTFMIEPTESEDKAELDRFINAMMTIKEEIDAIAQGQTKLEDSPLVHAPHSQADIYDNWQRPYNIEQAAFGADYLKENKFWPSVNRIDDVYGDRHLFCSCPTVESYEQD